MRQSSVAQEGGKPTVKASGHVGGITLAIGVVGAAFVGLGSWAAGRALLSLHGWALAGVLAAAIGAGLLVAAGLLNAFSPANDLDAAERLSHSLDGVSRGDLRRDLPEVHRSSAWDAVFQHAAHAIRFLRTTIGTLQQLTRETRERAEDVTGQASAVHSLAQRTSELTANAAQHAGTLRDEARAASDDLQRLTSDTNTLAIAARNEQDASKRARLATQQTTEDLVAAATRAKALDAGHTATSAELEGLTLAVDEVREFVALVRKMARQSKLLSLNAAMEAARAGEQGTGFGVVASEVRRLAKSSSDAVVRTEKLLAEMIDRSAAARGNSLEAAVLARELQESLARAATGMERLRVAESGCGSGEAAESVPARVAAVAANVERLALGIEAIADSVRDARLAAGGQVSRGQELVTAAHALSRVAAKGAGVAAEFQVVAQDPAADEVLVGRPAADSPTALLPA